MSRPPFISLPNVKPTHTHHPPTSTITPKGALHLSLDDYLNLDGILTSNNATLLTADNNNNKNKNIHYLSHHPQSLRQQQSTSLNAVTLTQQHGFDSDNGSESDSDGVDPSDDELIPRGIQRKESSLGQTLREFSKMSENEATMLKKVQTEDYLEMDEQNELVNQMRENAKIMASVWRYVCLLCTIVWSLCCTMLFLCHVVIGKEISFYKNLFTHLDNAQFAILHIPITLSMYSNINLAHQLPRFSDMSVVMSTSLTILSDIIYITTLFMVDLLTFHDLMLPIFNTICFCIIGYAYYNIKQSYKLINELKRCRYNYESV